MTPFKLQIVTPDGRIYDGEAEMLTVRTTGGDVGIRARHIDYVSPLGMGQAVIVAGGMRRTAACIGGMISVRNGEVTLVPTTFEWADQIDPDRAQRAIDRAQQALKQANASDMELKLIEARLKRALVRKSVHSSQE